jgi:hypothetical protein
MTFGASSLILGAACASTVKSSFDEANGTLTITTKANTIANIFFTFFISFLLLNEFFPRLR